MPPSIWCLQRMYDVISLVDFDTILSGTVFQIKQVLIPAEDPVLESTAIHLINVVRQADGGLRVGMVLLRVGNSIELHALCYVFARLLVLTSQSAPPSSSCKA